MCIPSVGYNFPPMNRICICCKLQSLTRILSNTLNKSQLKSQNNEQKDPDMESTKK